MTTNIERLYEERKKRLDITMHNGQADRVPVVSMVSTWGVYYAGYTLKEVLDDEEKGDEVVEKAYGDFYWDGIFGNPLVEGTDIYDILGGGTFALNADGMRQTKPGSIKVMNENEYPDLIKDPYDFLLNTIYPRRYKLLNGPYTDDKYKEMCTVADKIKEKGIKYKRYNDIAKSKGLIVSRQGSFFNPVDLILDNLRDFSGIMSDIKRQPEMVKEAGLAMVQYCIDNVEHSINEPEPGCAIFAPMHLPQFLSPKDFERVYWPSFIKLANYFTNKGYVIRYYFESNYEHLYDYLQELPKGQIVGLFEDDDLRKAKKFLGNNMAIAGGMPTSLLYLGSTQECIDYAKALIDDLAPGGGYIFAMNKIMLSPTDGRAENLKAVTEFAHEYGVYK
ncbi:MAG: hypothetical protein KGZ96_10520 [Clostridia bacterium]|nr:hypothetical protein [Clostridia bacterium]